KKYFYSLTEDFEFLNESTLTDTNLQNKALIHLQSILFRHGKTLSDFSNMLLSTNFIDSPSIITDEQNYNINELTHIIETGISQLNLNNAPFST
ncbi:185_t:CDS:1, partial [Cetraspora pellucida]